MSRPAHLIPRKAMVLAAGLATRMRPLTDTTAKPLLPLMGRTLLDHTLDRLAAVGVETVVVNAFWQAEKVVGHLANRPAPPRTIASRETVLLETGGGVRNALPLLGDQPFFVINGDAFWLDGACPALTRLAAAFDDSVDAVLLLHRTVQVQAETGPGDFTLDPWGVPKRRGERQVVPYIYAGLQIVSHTLLRGMPDGPFGMNRAWDRALAHGRLKAIVHDGLWFHLSTPADLADAEENLRAQHAGHGVATWH
jgi:MurNAc alpha-1-phosphate uridylyltransferase